MRKFAANRRIFSFRAIAALTLIVLCAVASYLAFAGWLTGMSRAAYYGYYELR